MSGVTAKLEVMERSRAATVARSEGNRFHAAEVEAMGAVNRLEGRKTISVPRRWRHGAAGDLDSHHADVVLGIPCAG
jgi:hypothetical protein